MTEQKLMAFWSYDQFPYTLYSEVDTFWTDKPSVVKVKGFGGSSFKYKHILPFEVGANLAKELDTLEKEYKREMTLLSMKYHTLLDELGNKYGLPVK